MDSSRLGDGPSRLPKGLAITGELSSDQDLFIDGTFDGQITLPERHLTISETGRFTGKLVARVVTISGTVDGTVTASDGVTLTDSALVTAHLQTPSIVIREGARFDGSVDPSRSEAALHVARYRQKHPDAAGS